MPARFNSGYMVVYFVGGSAGTAFGAAAVSWIGWTGTTLICAGAIVAAAALTILQRSPEPASGHADPELRAA